MSTRSLVTLVEWCVATVESFVSLAAPTGGVNEQKMASSHCFTQNSEILRWKLGGGGGGGGGRGAKVRK